MRRISSKISRNLKSVARITAGFVVAFYIYLAFFTALGHAYKEFYYLNDASLFFRITVIGLVVGAVVAVSDVFFLSRATKNLNFILTLFVRTAFYVTLSLGVLLLFVIWEEYVILNGSGSFSFESRVRTFFSGEFPVLTLYLSVVAFIISSFRLVIQRVGEKKFWNAVTGRYHTPHEEERVFMFLDLYSSTMLAELMGHERYHNLLDDVFNDIADPISSFGGEVYQHVGDSVVVTWKIQEGTRELNCIRCFFAILDRIKGLAEKYEDRYQHVPHLKAGLHSGKVIAGEVGEEKVEIVFHGDTVNTASRIQGECKKMGEQILLSKELLALFPEEELAHYSPQEKGTIFLEGRIARVSIYTVSDAGSASRRKDGSMMWPRSVCKRVCVKAD
ncbi:MAG: adenylate/guanylate cyclase domain-containing protein [Chlorobiales bacterium]|nr:adenylate/guanylate cyclase domain-containing protein [Chlorobiales bacterium]